MLLFVGWIFLLKEEYCNWRLKLRTGKVYPFFFSVAKKQCFSLWDEITSFLWGLIFQLPYYGQMWFILNLLYKVDLTRHMSNPGPPYKLTVKHSWYFFRTYISRSLTGWLLVVGVRHFNCEDVLWPSTQVINLMSIQTQVSWGIKPLPTMLHF